MHNLFSKSSVRIFGLSFLVIFVGTILLNLGFSFNFDFLKKESKEKNDSRKEKIQDLLKEKENKYRLKKETRLLGPAYADDINADPTAYSVVDYQSGEIIAEKNGSRQLPIASITKIMTAVVALDLAKPWEKFTISKRAAVQIPTKIGVVPGEKMSLEELLNASLLTSANDATEAIKEGIDKKYGQELFIEAMNIKAGILGLKNTSFSNPQGFDSPSNYSSARDLAVLSHYAISSYPLISSIAEKEYKYLPSDSYHKQFDLQNWNGLIGVYPGAKGIKIGSTEAAGKTTVVLATREEKTIIAVVLGAPGILERDLWAGELLDLGFEKKLGLKPANVSEKELLEKYSGWKYW